MIEIRYKCKCQTSEQTLHVLDRGADEDIVSYMEYVRRQMHHSSMSPRCKAKEVEYAKIPITDEGIGR